MPRRAATYHRVPFFAATIVERPLREPITFPDASRIPETSKAPSAMATSLRRKRTLVSVCAIFVPL